jgi:DNA excision repair protein ERCC-4
MNNTSGMTDETSISQGPTHIGETGGNSANSRRHRLAARPIIGARACLQVVVDSREQKPLTFPAEVKTIPGTLTAGDYSMPGFEEHCAIERKELSDLLVCITTERDRFKRELLRLRSYACKAVVVEATLADIMAGRYRSRVHPSAVVGSICSWMNRYKVPFVFAGNRDGAAVIVLSMLKNYRQQLRELMAFMNEATTTNCEP